MGDTGWYQRERAFVRRFARAVAADRFVGDELARAALAEFNPDSVTETSDWGRRVAVFQACLDTWRPMSGAEAPANFSDAALLASVPLRADPSRQLLLLVDVLGLAPERAAELLRLEPNAAAGMLGAERERIDRPLKGTVLVVEDEPLVALDFARALEQTGLDIIGIAGTRAAAVAMAERHEPDLLLADHDLGGGESGLDAVRDISRRRKVVSVLLTAFPDEILLGGEEGPAFVLTRPFDERALRAAVVQGLEALRTDLVT